MAWIRTLKFTVSWSLNNLITYTFAFVCLFVFYKTHNPIFVFCLLICLLVFVHTVEMYLADKTAEISMISGIEYFHEFNSCPAYFRRPGYLIALGSIFFFFQNHMQEFVRNIETLTKVRHI